MLLVVGEILATEAGQIDVDDSIMANDFRSGFLKQQVGRAVIIRSGGRIGVLHLGGTPGGFGNTTNTGIDGLLDPDLIVHSFRSERAADDRFSRNRVEGFSCRDAGDRDAHWVTGVHAARSQLIEE